MFELNKSENQAKLIFILKVKLFAYIVVVLIFLYVFFANTSPFFIESTYSLSLSSIPPLSPLNRVETVKMGEITLTKLKDDLVYFNTEHKYNYDKAKVKVKFANPDGNQKIELGFKDRKEWHYRTQLLDAPYLRLTGWTQTGDNLFLYQRDLNYTSVENFLESFNEQSIVGTIDYYLPAKNFVAPDYTPKKNKTVIDTPLRGRHTMYAYLSDEPFYMKISKKDLNWYADPDVLEVRVYKEGTLVFTAVLNDDGIENDSKQSGTPLEVEIANPGPELPESGVYKIVFDAESDLIITRIETNLHKIVFASPIYPVGNSVVYSDTIFETATTTLYTDSKRFSVIGYHDQSLQDILVNGITNTLALIQSELVIDIPVKIQGAINKIEIPKSDVVINGLGFFSFTKESYFIPNTYNIIPISSLEDISNVDYILSSYGSHNMEDGYTIVEREFDLKDAKPDKGNLSWIIRSPGLKESENEVIIKDIEVVLSNQGWLE